MKGRIIVQILLFVFPWFIRRRLLNSFYGYKIHKTAKIGFCIILCDELIMAEKSAIQSLTIIQNVNRVKLGYNSKISLLNYITGMNMRLKKFQYSDGAYCELVLGDHVRITTRHFIDCNGGVYLDDYCTVGGYKTLIMSHTIDIYTAKQTAGPIRLGKYSFVATNCMIHKGSVLPPYSMLTAGSLLNKAYTEEYVLYGGLPAKKIKDLDPVNTQYYHRVDPDMKA